MEIGWRYMLGLVIVGFVGVSGEMDCPMAYHGVVSDGDFVEYGVSVCLKGGIGDISQGDGFPCTTPDNDIYHGLELPSELSHCVYERCFCQSNLKCLAMEEPNKGTGDKTRYTHLCRSDEKEVFEGNDGLHIR